MKGGVKREEGNIVNRVKGPRSDQSVRGEEIVYTEISS